MEPELVLLLRFMAVLKALCAVGAITLVVWRMQRPISARLTAGYGAGAALMAVSPILIWNLTHIVAGAVVFHAGLALFICLAWADGRLSWPRRQNEPHRAVGLGRHEAAGNHPPAAEKFHPEAA